MDLLEQARIRTRRFKNKASITSLLAAVFILLSYDPYFNPSKLDANDPIFTNVVEQVFGPQEDALDTNLYILEALQNLNTEQ